METIYVMTCGCKLKADERVRVKNKAYRCPNHKDGRIDHLIKKCSDCHIEFTTKRELKTRCEECQKKQIRENNRRSKHKSRYGISIDDVKQNYEASCKTWDCINRTDCIDDAERAGRGRKPLPCRNCNRYKRLQDAV